ncbi:interleukin-1 receptor accessory protein-like 1-A isoform X1 [Branchiostoma floridae]|uniref:Soluble interferon alpha/beta receptor OPG204 n=2 Tax=Branchiostoma floridae TaxID=7739 RepID=A0A9J7KP34_BRAFL|nr:interleukin-1 receptor accessory protein-like 1-A isoform X1 [Branchiostoma floridae]
MYMKKGSLAFDSHDSTLCLKVKLIRRWDRRLTIMRSLQMYNAKTSSSVLMCAWMFLWAGSPNLSAALLANAAPSPVPPTDDHGYDYYDYYGDYGDACHNWQTNIQEIHWEIATVGEQMVLRCPFSECWDGYTTTWYRKGVPLKLNPPADEITQSGDAGEQLQFTRVRQEDAGTYTCQMTNGTHAFVGNVQLEATNPPSITPPSMEPVDPPMLQKVVGENATFVCRASYGVVGPATFPQLYWVKNNTFVNNSSRVVLRRTSRTDSDGSLYMNVRLSIYHLQEADFGQYTCIAHTTFGWTSQNATIENDGSVIG